MAVIQCPKCQGKLKFPDDSPPRRVKCPACGEGFQASASGPVAEGGSKSQKVAPPPPLKDEKAAADDDDRKSRSRDRDDDDRDRDRRRDDDDRDRRNRRDDDDDRDRDRRRRDEDDDDRDRDRNRRRDRDDDDRDRRRRDRDYDDDDDRDRRRRDRDRDDDRGSIFRSKSRRDEDDDYDDDRGSRSRRKKGGKVTKSQWDWTRKGLSFVNYGFFCQIGSFGALVLVFLLFWIGAHSNVLVAIACIPGLVGWILAAIGVSFIVAGPRIGNLMGLSIALVSVAGVHFFLLSYAAFFDPKLTGFFGRSSVNWLIMPSSLLAFPTMITARYMDTLIFFTGVFEIGRFVLLCLYLKEAGKLCKAREATNRCTFLMISLPCAIGGVLLFGLLGAELLKEAQPSITFYQIFIALYGVIMLGSYTLVYLITIKTSNDISDATWDGPKGRSAIVE